MEDPEIQIRISHFLPTFSFSSVTSHHHKQNHNSIIDHGQRQR